VDQYKTENAQLKGRIAQIEKDQRPADDWKNLETRASAAEARNKELENAIAFVRYEESSEFKTKHQEPYEKAWNRAVNELKEIPIGPQGQERLMTAQDFIAICQMPLAQARAFADENLGSFANDVMSHRKEVISLFEQMNGALEEAKKNSAQRLKDAQSQFSSTQRAVMGGIEKTFKSESESILADPKNGHYFKPKEGDQQWNDALERGFAFVDRAFNSGDPKNLKMKPEDRAAIVRAHAVLRARAAAFGPLKMDNTRLGKRVAELEKELAAYKKSEPPAGGTPGAPGAPAAPSNAWDRLNAGIAKRARPM